MSPDLRQIVDVAPLVQSGAVSPVTLVEACLEQIGARPEINAFIERFDRQALAEARTAEREIRAGGYRGPAARHSDRRSRTSIDVAGAKTTSGSALPATDGDDADAPAVANLRAAGAIIIGKTNLHEFAFGTTSEESAFGPVRNPLDPTRSAGGSSGGAAAALAAGHVLWRARHRHGRVDPHPVGGMRHGRAQGDDRRDLRAKASFRSARRSTTSDRWREPWQTPRFSSTCSLAARRRATIRGSAEPIGDSSLACRGPTSAIGSTPARVRRSNARAAIA